MCVSTTRLLWFVVLIAPAIAHADLYARYLPYPPPAEGRVYDNLDIYVSSGRVLMTGWNISGTTYSIWFDGQDGSFRVYDQEKQGYYLFSPRTFEADRVRQAGFRTEMESRLKGVPEQQRDAMRRSLEQIESTLLGGAAPAPHEYRGLAVEDFIGGVACMETEVLHRREKVRLLCTTDIRNIAPDEADRRTLAKMQQVAREIALTTPAGFQLVPRYPLDLEAGFPVRILYLDDDRELRLASVTTGPVDPIVLLSYRKHRRLPLPGT